MARLYIDTLSGEDIAKIELRLRPGKSSYSGFLGENESLKNVIYEDAQTLERLGITHEQIATSLENLIEHPDSDRRFKVEKRASRGIQLDPFREGWAPGTYANLDVNITNQNGESISFGGPIVGLIRNYQFFEGREVRYRLDPEKAVRVLGLNDSGKDGN